MGSENWSNALFSVGQNLGAMADRSFTRERDDANFRRQESLERMRQAHATQLQANAQSFQSTEGFLDRASNATEAEKQRTFEAGENQATREMQSEQYRRRDLEKIESQYSKQAADLYNRSRELQDKLAELEINPQAQFAQGKDEYVKKINSELAGLKVQTARTAMQKIQSLARAGDPRYKDMSTEEIAAEAGRQAGGTVELRKAGQNEKRRQLQKGATVEQAKSVADAAAAVEQARPAPPARRDIMDAPGVNRSGRNITRGVQPHWTEYEKISAERRDKSRHQRRREPIREPISIAGEPDQNTAGGWRPNTTSQAENRRR